MNLPPLDKEMLVKMGIAPNAMPIRPAFDLGIHIPTMNIGVLANRAATLADFIIGEENVSKC